MKNRWLSIFLYGTLLVGLVACGTRKDSITNGDLISYQGIAIVRDRGPDGIETLIVSDLETAKAMDLTPDELNLVEQVFKQARAVRKCRGQSRNNQVACFNQGGCSHKCHLYRVQLPIPSDQPPEFEDLDENERNFVDKEKGYGYLCGCDGPLDN